MPLKVGRGKNQCLAFTSKGHKRCRLEKEPNQKTCRIHKHYYEDWLTKHPPFYHIDHISRRHLREYVFQLQNRYVQLSETFLTGLAAPYFQYYAFVMRFTDYPILLNDRCFYTLMASIPLSLCISANRNLPEQFMKHLLELAFFLKDAPSCIVVLRYVLYECARYFHQTNLSFDTGTFILTNLFELPGWRYLLYWNGLDETLQRIWANLTVPETTFWTMDVFRQHLQLFYVYHASTIRLTTRVFKQELMAKAFHPERIQRLLDAGYVLDDIFDNL